MEQIVQGVLQSPHIERLDVWLKNKVFWRVAEHVLLYLRNLRLDG
jgi:ribosomal protein L19